MGNTADGSTPKIVCLCGSTAHLNEFEVANRDYTLRGFIVLSIGVDMKVRDKEYLDATYTKEQQEAVKDRLDCLHRRKIDLADEVYVLNVGNRIGDSTQKEIEYAQRTGKPVSYLNPIDQH